LFGRKFEFDLKTILITAFKFGNRRTQFREMSSSNCWSVFRPLKNRTPRTRGPRILHLLQRRVESFRDNEHRELDLTYKVRRKKPEMKRYRHIRTRQIDAFLFLFVKNASTRVQNVSFAAAIDKRVLYSYVDTSGRELWINLSRRRS